MPKVHIIKGKIIHLHHGVKAIEESFPGTPSEIMARMEEIALACEDRIPGRDAVYFTPEWLAGKPIFSLVYMDSEGTDYQDDWVFIIK